MTIDKIIEMPMEEFVNYIANAYITVIPERIETLEEATAAASLMAKCSNSYSYLTELYALLKIESRRAKRDQNYAKKNNDNDEIEKIYYEDINDKANFTQDFAKVAKQQYDTLSRIFTIRSYNLKELKMNQMY